LADARGPEVACSERPVLCRQCDGDGRSGPQSCWRWDAVAGGEGEKATGARQGSWPSLRAPPRSAIASLMAEEGWHCRW